MYNQTETILFMDKKQHTTETSHQKLYKKDLFSFIEKENLTDNINLSGPPINDSKNTINLFFNIHDPLDTIPLSETEIENIFHPITEKITLELLQKHQNFDPVIRQLKSWHKYKTEPLKTDTPILGNKTLLRYFRKFNNSSINDNTDILEYQSPNYKVPCLLLSMMLIDFHTSHSLHTKGHSGAEKTYSNFKKKFYFTNAPIWIKVLSNYCITCQLNKPYQTKIKSQKQVLKHKVYILITEFLSIQKDHYHHPQKETSTLWSLLTHSHTT